MVSAVMHLGANRRRNYRALSSNVLSISVKDAWSRAKPEGTDVGVGYLTITNDGDAPDRLVSAEAAFAGQAEIHQMTMNNGVMQMRPVPEGVTVPAKGKLVFSPPDVHGSQRPAKGGRYRRRQFDFKHAGKVEVTFHVQSMGAAGRERAHHH